MASMLVAREHAMLGVTKPARTCARALNLALHLSLSPTHMASMLGAREHARLAQQ